MPEVYEKVIRERRSRGRTGNGVLTNTLVPGKFFDDTLAQYKAELRGVSGISPRAVDILAREAVSDWLLRCPLEFE